MTDAPTPTGDTTPSAPDVHGTAPGSIGTVAVEPVDVGTDEVEPVAVEPDDVEPVAVEPDDVEPGEVDAAADGPEIDLDVIEADLNRVERSLEQLADGTYFTDGGGDDAGSVADPSASS